MTRRTHARDHLAPLALAIGVLVGVACSSGTGCKPAPPAREPSEAKDTVTSRNFTVDDASAELWPAVRGVAYRPATAEQKRALFELVDHLWRGDVADEPALSRLASDAGMRLERWTVDHHRTWVVREPATQRAGGGIYLIRAEPPGPGPQVLFEAPHVYFDKHTETIAASAFFAADAPGALRGLFTSSLHRYQQTADQRERRAENPSDVGHNPDHLYQSATAAAVAAGPLTIVQLHGFDADLHDDPRTSGADVIVSAARADGSTPQSTAVAAAIAASLRVVVARFPEDTRALGATTNVQARLVEGVAAASFVHVEIGAELRRSLARDPARSAAMGKAVVEALVAGAP